MDRELDRSEPTVAGIGFQFHATPEELVDLARAWRDAHGLHVAAEHFFPDWRVWSLDKSTKHSAQPRTIDRLALRRQAFDLTATTDRAFAQRNLGSLFITVGRLMSNELGESSIGGYTSDPAEIGLWRRLIRKVRADSHKGATIHNWATSGHLASHRHTTGAHRMAEQRVRIVQFKGGGNEYTFDDIPGHGPRGGNRD
jgi:hypothetical protein